uniref:BPTI/Kunitz inhibitor domain-containing protein n=1 Tax=Caenorhabditis tropicalis TaxID=1561998 RepID=A0A1I7UQ54_9PELO
MNAVSLALFLLLAVSMVQVNRINTSSNPNTTAGSYSGHQKNRKYNDPPFCFAYNREYNENDVTSSCSGYQFDCFDSTGAQIGGSIKFKESDCESMSVFRSFSDADFQKRLDEASKYATTAEASGH